MRRSSSREPVRKINDAKHRHDHPDRQGRHRPTPSWPAQAGDPHLFRDQNYKVMDGRSAPAMTRRHPVSTPNGAVIVTCRLRRRPRKRESLGIAHGPLRVKAGADPPSTTCSAAHSEVVDGRPAPTMTGLHASAPTGAAIIARRPRMPLPNPCAIMNGKVNAMGPEQYPPSPALPRNETPPYPRLFATDYEKAILEVES